MIRVILILVALVTATPLAAQEATAQFGAATASHRITLRTTTDVAILAPTIEAFLAGRPDLGLDYEQWGSNDLYDLSQRGKLALARHCQPAPGADLARSDLGRVA
ncbi:MAG: hypothetical protein P8X51_12910 [Maritimibacter sp.]